MQKMTMWLRAAQSAVRCSVLALGMVGCGSSDSGKGAVNDAGNDTGQCKPLNLVTYIGQLPGDAETLQTMLAVNKSNHPDVCVTHTPISTIGVVDGIGQVIASGTIPDVFEVPADQMPSYLAKQGPNSVYALDDYLASPAKADVVSNVYPFFLEDAKFNGKTYGMPFAGMCTNGFYYNKTIFAANHLSPPTTVAELRTVCATLKAAGITPIEIVGLSVFLQSIMAAVMGVDAYYSYMKGATPDETLLSNAVDFFSEMVDNYVDLPPAPYAPVDHAFGEFMASRGAMLFTAEWVEALVNELGWTPGVDYGFSFVPGNAGLFAYSMQELSIPSNASNLQGALEFLDSALSAETQNRVGIVHARKYTDKTLLNTERRILVDGMEQAKYHLTINIAAPWEVPVFNFIQSKPRDKETLLQVLRTTR